MLTWMTADVGVPLTDPSTSDSFWPLVMVVAPHDVVVLDDSDTVSPVHPPAGDPLTCTARLNDGVPVPPV